MARSRQAQQDSTDGPEVTVYYAPDGAEYPVPGELSPVEAVQLRALGYSTERPAEDAEAVSEPVPDAGPLSGAAPSPEG